MEVSRKNNFLEIKRFGKEVEIKLFVVVEILRLLFYLWFIILILVGTLLNLGFVQEDYRVFMNHIFGSVNVCVCFNTPPAAYVLPVLYAIWPVIVFLYCICSIFRAWIGLGEKKIGTFSFVLYLCIFVYLFWSSIFFALSIAIQPDLDRPELILPHVLPFTNLIIILTLLQVAVTWFGFNVSWRGMKTPKVFELCTFICVLSLVLASIMKVTQHINSLGSLEFDQVDEMVKVKGLWWDVKDPELDHFFHILDVFWVILAFAVPLGQSLYLSCMGFDSHGLMISIGDNQEGRDTQSISGRSVRIDSGEIQGIQNRGYANHSDFETTQEQNNGDFQ